MPVWEENAPESKKKKKKKKKRTNEALLAAATLLACIPQAGRGMGRDGDVPGLRQVYRDRSADSRLHL